MENDERYTALELAVRLHTGSQFVDDIATIETAEKFLKYIKNGEIPTDITIVDQLEYEEKKNAA